MREAIEGMRRTYENRCRNLMDRVADVEGMEAVRLHQAKYMIYRNIVNDLEEVLAQHDPNNPRQTTDTERND